LRALSVVATVAVDVFVPAGRDGTLAISSLKGGKR
jgi:hypothetical protein